MHSTPSISELPDRICEKAAPTARYMGFDILKLICSFLVVYIHIPMPGLVGDLIYTVARIAVPIFFMITGFFYDRTLHKGGTGKQIKKIALLFVYANGIFFVGNCLETLLYGKSLAQYISASINTESLISFFVFNVSPWGVHLWYLGAILYTLLFMAAFFRPDSKKILWFFIPLLLSVDLLLGEYSLLFFGKKFPIYWVRNFLFVGIPYFLMGNLICSCQKVILKHLTTKKARLLVAVSLIANFVELFLLNANQLSTGRNHYISTTCLAVSVFLLFQTMMIPQTKLTASLASVSRSCTTWIYILHPLFITALNLVASFLHKKSEFRYIGCIVVYLCVTIFVYVVGVMMDRLKSKAIRNR